MITDRHTNLVAWALYLALIALLADAHQAWAAWRTSTNFAAELQAYGAMIALVVAIGVPAWQRHLDRKDRLRQIGERNAHQLELLYMATEGLQQFIEDLFLIAQRPEEDRRSAKIDSAGHADILSRLALVESYEVSPTRHPLITAFHARKILRRAITACTTHDGSFACLSPDDPEAFTLRREARELCRTAERASDAARDAHLRSDR